MNPGRELDALIAEKIMNLPKFEPKVLSRLGRHIHPEGSPVCIICGRDVRDDKHGMCLARYSTDIAAAWEVVGKLQERGLDMAIEVSDEHSVCVFGTGAYLGDDLSGPSVVGAPTAPHAICLAALKAVGINDP